VKASLYFNEHEFSCNVLNLQAVSMSVLLFSKSNSYATMQALFEALKVIKVAKSYTFMKAQAAIFTANIKLLRHICNNWYSMNNEIFP